MPDALFVRGLLRGVNPGARLPRSLSVKPDCLAQLGPDGRAMESSGLAGTMESLQRSQGEPSMGGCESLTRQSAMPSRAASRGIPTGIPSNGPNPLRSG
jgi:hypothetical protein